MELGFHSIPQSQSWQHFMGEGQMMYSTAFGQLSVNARKDLTERRQGSALIGSVALRCSQEGAIWPCDFGLPPTPVSMIDRSSLASHILHIMSVRHASASCFRRSDAELDCV
jgi:hypothetical protein